MDRSSPVELCACASYTDVQQAPGQNPQRVRVRIGRYAHYAGPYNCPLCKSHLFPVRQLRAHKYSTVKIKLTWQAYQLGNICAGFAV